MYVRSSEKFILGPGQVLGARLATHNERRLTLRSAIRRSSVFFSALRAPLFRMGRLILPLRRLPVPYGS